MMAETEAMKDWASLPNHLLDSVFARLLPITKDCTRFSAVCTHWRSVAWENFRRRQLPFLLVPTGNIGSWTSYKMTTIMGEFELSLSPNGRVYGCCYGWLILGENSKVSLLNPFSGKRIGHPPLERLGLQFRSRWTSSDIKTGGVLSVSPDIDPDGYVLMVLYGIGGKLAFIKAGDKAWAYIDYFENQMLHGCLDLSYSNGLFLALHYGGVLLSIDVRSRSGLVVMKKVTPRYTRPPHLWSDADIVKSHGKGRFMNYAYLVKSYENGKEHLLKVLRKCGTSRSRSWEFDIYKLGDDNGNEELWIEVKDLGDVSLFLGESHSVFFFISAGSERQPNSIYFYNDNDFLCRSTSLVSEFSLKDKRVRCSCCNINDVKPWVKELPLCICVS